MPNYRTPKITERRISERRKLSNVELINMTLKMDMDRDTDMGMDFSIYL